MHIKIAARLKPYSKIPGTRCVIPMTSFAVEVFPTLIRLYDMRPFTPCLVDEISFELQGPVNGFTVQQDLERGGVRVWGDAVNGYFRYVIFGDFSEEPVKLKVEKLPDGTGLHQKCGVIKVIKLDEKVRLPILDINIERLSFGSHKSQNVCKITERWDMREILPFWYRLSQLTPDDTTYQPVGTAALLEECRMHIENREVLKVIPVLKSLSNAAFRDLFFPMLVDELYRGFDTYSADPNTSASPLMILSHLRPLIRKLFIRMEGNRIMPLPQVPPEISCGRMTCIALEGIGSLDLEWRKRDIRRMILRATHSTTMELALPKSLKRYRFKEKCEQKHRILTEKDAIELSENKEYYFDNFSG